MRYSTLFIAAAAFTGYASAQTSSTSSTSSTSTGSSTSATLTPVPTAYSIDPNSVSQSQRSQWCLGQKNTCLGICLDQGGNQPSANDCEQANLTYDCACPSGSSFNMSNYQQSLPAQVCLVWQSQCVNDHPNDFEGIAACRAVQCGNETIAAQGVSSTSSSATTSATESTSPTSSTASASASASHGAAMALHMGENYGLGMFATAILALVGFAL